MALSRSWRTRPGPFHAFAQSGFRAESSALSRRIDTARAKKLRLRQLARARAMGATGLRLPRVDRTVVCRYFLQQLLQERPVADRVARERRRSAIPCSEG